MKSSKSIFLVAAFLVTVSAANAADFYYYLPKADEAIPTPKAVSHKPKNQAELREKLAAVYCKDQVLWCANTKVEACRESVAIAYYSCPELNLDELYPKTEEFKVWMQCFAGVFRDNAPTTAEIFGACLVEG